jgi:hypothetical protein
MNKIFKRELNITFVYIFIFIVGMAIVFFMTSYINSVTENNNDEIAVVDK